MAWHNHEDGAEYEALGVTLPRLDDHRKMNDNMSVGRYAASNGEFLAVDDVTGDRVNLIDSDGAQRLRMASMLADQVPCAKMQLAAPAEFIESVVLQPGVRAVVPVEWSVQPNSESFHCAAHPEAPVGLVALPGECPAKEEMSICVENESPLPITITEKDCLAAGTREEEVPTLESCALFQAQREKFYSLIGWKAGQPDRVRQVESPQQDRVILVVIHTAHRFVSCDSSELPEEWRDHVVLMRTLTYESGEVDYIPEGWSWDGAPKEPIQQWKKERPWCGQTVFVLAAVAGSGPKFPSLC